MRNKDESREALFIRIVSQFKQAGVKVTPRLRTEIRKDLCLSPEPWVFIKPRKLNPKMKDKLVSLQQIMEDAGLLKSKKVTLVKSFTGNATERIPFYGSQALLVYLFTDLLVDCGLLKNNSGFFADLAERFSNGLTGASYDRKVLYQAKRSGYCSNDYDDVLKQIMDLFNEG